MRREFIVVFLWKYDGVKQGFPVVPEHDRPVIHKGRLFLADAQMIYSDIVP